MFNKPKGCIVSEKDPQNRKTIYDIITNNNKRLMYIGRLDYNSEGLLLLTNNGQLKRYFELEIDVLSIGNYFLLKEKSMKRTF